MPQPLAALIQSEQALHQPETLAIIIINDINEYILVLDRVKSITSKSHFSEAWVIKFSTHFLVNDFLCDETSLNYLIFFFII